MNIKTSKGKAVGNYFLKKFYIDIKPINHSFSKYELLLFKHRLCLLIIFIYTRDEKIKVQRWSHMTSQRIANLMHPLILDSTLQCVCWHKADPSALLYNNFDITKDTTDTLVCPLPCSGHITMGLLCSVLDVSRVWTLNFMKESWRTWRKRSIASF